MAGGRKSKYHTHVEPKLLLIEAWARDGLTLEDIAKKKEKRPSFSRVSVFFDLLTRPDRTVAKSLDGFWERPSAKISLDTATIPTEDLRRI
ncbi:hypothetical protein ACL02P_15390 [Paenibacillus sp. MB22_1]|uniref:hypothetical protein n=1 Tax=Paenibacillus sp. MB22_1 TaxID=3383121 RepID=UPI0039A18537